MDSHCDAVVAVHRPELQRLQALLAALAGQVRSTRVVDDAPDDPHAAMLAACVARAGATLLRQPRNLGQAAALNRGIAAAAAGGARRVLLMDQDSLPQPAMVARLQAALDNDAQAAAAGAGIVDGDGGVRPYWRIVGLRRRRLPARGERPLACDFLITSGCLLSLSAYAQVGGFDERLFIDNVDLDWCLRARRQGFTLLGVPGARLEHRIGERRAVGPLSLTTHPPARLYTMTRNRVHLYRQPHVPLGWIADDLLRLGVKSVVTAAFVAPRRAGLAAMLAGARDGWRGRLGAPRQSAR